MDEDKRTSYRMLASLSAVGFTLVFATVIGLYLGIKIDQWLDTSPWFTGIFFLFGIIAGFRNLFRYAKQNQDGSDKGGKKKS
jgi:ATP synthase protein I